MPEDPDQADYFRLPVVVSTAVRDAWLDFDGRLYDNR
jgi:hypothetical protein